MRTASVLTPRRTSHASNGPGTALSDFCRKKRRSADEAAMRDFARRYT